jgi:hypothetical protein
LGLKFNPTNQPKDGRDERTTGTVNVQRGDQRRAKRLGTDETATNDGRPVRCIHGLGTIPLLSMYQNVPEWNRKEEEGTML